MSKLRNRIATPGKHLRNERQCIDLSIGAEIGVLCKCDCKSRCGVPRAISPSSWLRVEIGGEIYLEDTGQIEFKVVWLLKDAGEMEVKGLIKNPGQVEAEEMLKILLRSNCPKMQPVRS